jgi:myosin heavy subunit
MIVASTKNARGKGKCAICKNQVKFYTVYLDFDEGHLEKEEAEGENTHTDVERLKVEWETVHRDLSTLLSCDVTKDNDEHVNTEDQGTQDVRDIICATIDLTQTPPRKDSSQNPVEPTSAATGISESECIVSQQDKQQIQSLLSHLQQIHTNLLDLAPTTKSQLHSKFLSLQRTNNGLETQLTSLQHENTTLQSQLNQANTTLFERNVETEREKRKYQDSNSKYYELYNVHNEYQAKSQAQIERLQKTNTSLQEQMKQLRNITGLADVKEMNEINEKYTKMSQRVYDLEKENRLLKRRMEEMERRRKEMERIRVEVAGKKSDASSDGESEYGFDHDDAAEGSDDYTHNREEAVRRVNERGISFNSGNRGEFRNYNDNYRISTTARSSRALDILDSAPSRKSNVKSGQPTHARGRGNSNVLKDIGRWDNDDPESDSDPFDFPLLMKTSAPKRHSCPITRPNNSSGGQSSQWNNTPVKAAASKPMPFHRNNSLNSTASQTAGTKRSLKESATLSKKYSRMSSQSISSFFKPK